MTDGQGASLIYDAVGDYMLEAIGEWYWIPIF